jgi:hypothetical protein
MKEWKRRRRQRKHLFSSLAFRCCVQWEFAFWPIPRFFCFPPHSTNHNAAYDPSFDEGRRKTNESNKLFNESNYILKINYPVRIFALVTSASDGKLFLVNFHVPYYLFWIYIWHKNLFLTNLSRLPVFLPDFTKMDSGFGATLGPYLWGRHSVTSY